MRRSRLAIAALLVFGGWGLASSASAQSPVARQVAAPASDIVDGIVRLPDPASTPTSSCAAIVPITFERDGAGWSFSWSYPVERSGTLVVAMLSPAAASWRLTGGPRGLPLQALEAGRDVERRVELAGEALSGWIVDRREVHGALAGPWTLRIDASSPAEGWLIASANGELRAQAHVTTHRLVVGDPIAVAARVRGPELFAVERADLAVDSDNGAFGAAMHDDGLHEDGAAGDGLFGALLPEGVLGRVRARVELAGTTRSGAAFLRHSQVAFEVLERRIALDGSARSRLLDDGRLEIAIGSVPIGAPQRIHVSAEVWGSSASGERIPVAWLSRMLEPPAAQDPARWELPLALDLDWLAVAAASAPLELRQVRVQDPDTEGVLDSVERIEFATPALPAPSADSHHAATWKMLTGAQLEPPPEFAAKRALMLVHGYCSSGSIWPAADFTAPKLEFLDPNANRTHDQFAQLIAARAAAARLSSFGVVAHSQGGPASLHLLTYYTSGLDRANVGRRIQSLASPYQGTPLASLGAFACGVNNDMTPSGAATWLAGIPSWARAEVFTWTTSNSGSACNAITSLFLTDPEDGTVEKFRGELPGGNNMGHVTGWCHTTGMSNPASYTDHTRNQAMDAAAAR
jgi:hypothetical protein